MKILFLTALVLTAGMTGIVKAETVTLGRADISDDTYLKRSAPSENFGRDASLIVATNSGPDDESCTLLRFDLPEMKGLVVKKATLTLTSSFGSTDLEMTQRIYKATAAWSQDTATWDSDSANYDSSDPDASTSTITPVGPEKNGTSFNFDVTAIVRSWYKNPATNYGFFIMNDAGEKSLIGYYSSQLGYASPPSPQLTIEYARD